MGLQLLRAHDLVGVEAAAERGALVRGDAKHEDLGVVVDPAHEGGVEDEEEQEVLVAVEVAHLGHTKEKRGVVP